MASIPFLHLKRAHLVAFILIALLAGLAALQVWVLQGVPTPACPAGGNIDRISLDLDGMEATLKGWAITPAFEGELSATLNGRELDVGNRSERNDVAAVFPQCPAAQESGFSLRVPLAQLDMAHGTIAIRPRESTSERAVAVGFDPTRLPPFGVLDPQDDIRYDHRNVVSGWAISPGSSVRVKLMAGERVLAEMTTGRTRSEVAAVFRGWPDALNSGFEFLLNMRELPRGRYPLRVVLENARGERTELPGPRVEHDEAWGILVSPSLEYLNPKRLSLAAWVAAYRPIAQVEVVDEFDRTLGDMELRESNVTYLAPDDPRSARHSKTPAGRGNLYKSSTDASRLAPGVHRLRARVTDVDGQVSYLTGPLVVQAPADRSEPCAGEPVRVFYPGGTTLFRTGFHDMQRLRAIVAGGCVEMGLRGRVEYLRTTRGREHDFEFDPDFPAQNRIVGGQEMLGDTLRLLLDTAVRVKAPLLISFDGGVWADASFPAPAFDVVDNLEEDERLVQWNQWNRSEPDDALRGMSGSFDNPQLARMMTLNRYNERFRHYKKRNLQSAVAVVVEFMRAHPDLYVGINLDPDNYINPWFTDVQWYDYNPDTLRQFREWLLHLGPYADGGELASSRYAEKLTLADANRIAGRRWERIEDIDPPRDKIDYSQPWQQIWSQFKRYLVAQHYADLARWAREAGMPADRIYTAVGMDTADIAVTLTDQAHGWMDQAGVSVVGGKPPDGHLGAILYGASSRNEGSPRSGRTLFDNVRALDPHWGAIEFHPASLVFREKLPSEIESYRTMLALLNGGAHVLSPMRGSAAGEREIFPQDFRAYDAMEGSTFEYELVWWLREWRARPAGSLYFPFGNTLVSSDDGWRAGGATVVKPQPGRLLLQAKDGVAQISSPHWDGIRLDYASTLRVEGAWPGAALIAQAQLSDGSTWEGAVNAPGALLHIPARPDRLLTQLTLSWRHTGSNPLALDSVAWTPQP